MCVAVPSILTYYITRCSAVIFRQTAQLRNILGEFRWACNHTIDEKGNVFSLNRIYIYVYMTARFTIAVLSHRGLKNMSDWFLDVILICIYVKQCIFILTPLPLKCVPYGPIDNTSTLVLVLTWCQTGDKALQEAALGKFYNPIQRRRATTRRDPDKIYKKIPSAFCHNITL